MSHPLSQRGQKRRQAILDAATDAFLQHGYEGTTLDMIIAQAGGSRRSLYDYFGDKQGLFGAVIRYHTDKLVEEVRSIDVIGMSAREGLTLLAKNFVFALLEPVNLELYRLLITQAPAFPELSRSAYQAGPALLLSELEKYLDHLQRQGQLPARLPTPHTARQFLGMVKAEFQLCALLTPEQLPEKSAISAHIQDCVTFLLDNH
ncbi:MAG: TetR/AcrR family transcriptional regulator [Alcanivorax sp.]|jgi:AcrR family transcriptional regulator|uniref:TetR/AcrR family transcriptional regulator n=1 Tax=Alcanivorax sp. TaxID=1872427 RepID=UPI00261BFEAF|nr:TetR/AcrR family transcriptional regulator [Alcanivorax sp.]MDF1724465.1 TetR/AcrR family transcriptional regulator [Alcanivorax sp.]